MAERRRNFLKTLSGRFLILTVIFVMLAEVLIFVPSIARFRADFMLTRLKQAQIAALTQLAAEDMVSPELEKELLANARSTTSSCGATRCGSWFCPLRSPRRCMKPMICGWPGRGS